MPDDHTQYEGNSNEDEVLQPRVGVVQLVSVVFIVVVIIHANTG
ncbi:light-harvesting protein [Jonesia denitrificans]|nr:light-harvesting protein [Jonesia denitrificans]